MNKLKNVIKAIANRVKNSIKRGLLYTKSILTSPLPVPCACSAALASKRGEGFVDTALKILISIVVGALILTTLYALFGDTIMPTLKTKITELFSYSGT